MNSLCLSLLMSLVNPTPQVNSDGMLKAVRDAGLPTTYDFRLIASDTVADRLFTQATLTAEDRSKIDMRRRFMAAVEVGLGELWPESWVSTWTYRPTDLRWDLTLFIKVEPPNFRERADANLIEEELQSYMDRVEVQGLEWNRRVAQAEEFTRKLLPNQGGTPIFRRADGGSQVSEFRIEALEARVSLIERAIGPFAGNGHRNILVPQSKSTFRVNASRLRAEYITAETRSKPPSKRLIDKTKLFEGFYSIMSKTVYKVKTSNPFTISTNIYNFTDRRLSYEVTLLNLQYQIEAKIEPQPNVVGQNVTAGIPVRDEIDRLKAHIDKEIYKP